MKAKYECEICGSIYDTPAQAEFCETFRPLPPSTRKVGDEILIKLRYEEEPDRDVIESIGIEPSFTQSAYRSWLKYGDEGIDKFERVIEEDKSIGTLHEYAYITKESHQTGKDDFTARIYEWNIVEPT